ncbi:class I SAM-dependent methyltransferase [Nisaea nitritireducens]|uniref:class I SAM-dependent methyltransferase n=1 Tax=Nisaea nitritireducens TaxID=568392 RepID=UPI0018687786|nr:methyltransferase domain-containing protein [Nisaea nitritireducens]
MERFLEKAEAIDASCPICFTKTAWPFIKTFRVPDIPAEFTFIDDNEVVCCTQCRTLYRWPMAVLSDEEEQNYGISYYDQMTTQAQFESHVHEHFERQKSHYEAFKTVIADRYDLNDYQRWLDVGSCGCGTAMQGIEITTVEPDPRVVAYAKKLYTADRIHNNTIQSFKSDTLFDGVTFQSSLYCIPDAEAALAKANKLLRDDGLLVITITSIFTGSHEFEGDAHTHRIEDCIRGDVMWVYYSRESLSAMAARQGFEYVDQEVVRVSYSPHRTLTTFLFRKVDHPVSGPTVEEIAGPNARNIETLLASFEDETQKTLSMFDRADTAFFGEPSLFEEFSRYHTFRNGPVFVDGIGGANPSSTVRLTSLTDLFNLVANSKIKHVVLCSFRNKEQVLGNMLRFVPIGGIRIFLPTRVSGMKDLNAEIFGQQQLAKAFAVQEIGIAAAQRSTYVEKL